MMTSHGYVKLYLPDHPHADMRGDVYEHIVVAARVLGRPLPVGAEVHHVNDDGTDNQHRNLVICDSHAYHFLLHVRTRSYRAVGNTWTLKCAICKQWDCDVIKAGSVNRHRACHSAQQCERERRNKIKRSAAT